MTAELVHQFYQKASVTELGAAGAIRSNSTVLIDTGVIYFSPLVVHDLLELARSSPLDACSYLGVDNGDNALRVELYRCGLTVLIVCFASVVCVCLLACVRAWLCLFVCVCVY